MLMERVDRVVAALRLVLLAVVPAAVPPLLLLLVVFAASLFCEVPEDVLGVEELWSLDSLEDVELIMLPCFLASLLLLLACLLALYALCCLIGLYISIQVVGWINWLVCIIYMLSVDSCLLACYSTHKKS